MEEVSMPSHTVITGPSGVGKTRLTARSLEEWVKSHGSEGVVILEFGPDIEYDGRIIGARLDHWAPIPPNAWKGIVDTRAPRLEGESQDAVLQLAKENATICGAVIERIPEHPSAVFINDATIPFQHPDANPEQLLDRVSDVDHVVVNAYVGEEFGNNRITDQERQVIERFRAWADEEIALTVP